MWAMLAQSKGCEWLDGLGDEYLVEEKVKGIRCKAEIKKGKVRLIGRSGADFTDSFPEIVEALEWVREDVVFDGEIGFRGKDGRWDESQVIARANGSAQMNRLLAKVMPATFYVFDVIGGDGDLIVRKAKAASIWLDRGWPADWVSVRWEVLGHVGGGRGRQLFDQVVADGGEGVMVKKVKFRYRAGRSWDWIKVKPWKKDKLWAVALTEGKIEGYGAIVLVDWTGKYVGKAGGLSSRVIEGFKKENKGVFGAVTVPVEVCREVALWLKDEGTGLMGIPVVIRYLAISKKGILQSAEFNSV